MYFPCAVGHLCKNKHTTKQFQNYETLSETNLALWFCDFSALHLSVSETVPCKVKKKKKDWFIFDTRHSCEMEATTSSVTSATNPPVAEKPADQEVTPWDVGDNVNYDKLIDLFGCTPIDEALLQRMERVSGKPVHPWLRRGLFFSHRYLSSASWRNYFLQLRSSPRVPLKGLDRDFGCGGGRTAVLSLHWSRPILGGSSLGTHDPLHVHQVRTFGHTVWQPCSRRVDPSSGGFRRPSMCLW